MIILGIDPGSRRIGFGLIRKEKGLLEMIDAGILKIKSKNDLDAIVEIKNQLSRIISEYAPALMAIEKLYFVKNQKTALAVAQSRGVIIFVATEKGLPIKEFSPNEIKAGLTGYGLADKKAVAKMVKLILKKPDLKILDDATDALAVAIVASSKNPS